MPFKVRLEKFPLPDVDDPQFWMLGQAYAHSPHGGDEDLFQVIEDAYWSMTEPQQETYMRQPAVRSFLSLWCPRDTVFVATLPWSAMPLLDTARLDRLVSHSRGCLAAELQPSLEEALGIMDERAASGASDAGLVYSETEFRVWVETFLHAVEEHPDAEVVVS